MTMKEIRKALMGKTVSHYDGFSGNSHNFKIGDIENTGNYIRVRPAKGVGWGVLICKANIPQLLAGEEIIHKNEVDHCPYEKRWSINSKK